MLAPVHNESHHNITMKTLKNEIRSSCHHQKCVFFNANNIGYQEKCCMAKNSDSVLCSTILYRFAIFNVWISSSFQHSYQNFGF